MKQIQMIYDNDMMILSADAGRVKVCYYEKECELRVVRTEDGELLHQMHARFDLLWFIERVNHFYNVCNHR